MSEQVAVKKQEPDPWIRYEQLKAELPEGLSAEDYQSECKRIADELGIWGANNMTEKLKTCANCEEEKPTSQFTRNKVNFKWGAKDGLNIYCRACAYSGKPLKSKRKPGSALKPKFDPANRGAVLRAVANGNHSREQIELFTRLHMEEVVDILAHLAFVKQKLRIVKVGEQREFHLRESIAA